MPQGLDMLLLLLSKVMRMSAHRASREHTWKPLVRAAALKLSATRLKSVTENRQ